MLKHWKELTLFLRVAGVPLDNNVCERALKMAIPHRKNLLGWKGRLERGTGSLMLLFSRISVPVPLSSSIKQIAIKRPKNLLRGSGDRARGGSDRSSRATRCDHSSDRHWVVMGHCV
ncbi:MAG: transposase [Pirellulales bacterium]|nr:transposase [Pirellulales bacterium]